MEAAFYLSSDRLSLAGGLEGREVVRARLRGFDRRGRSRLARNLMALAGQAGALLSFYRHMRGRRPDVAVGFGSYASAPGILAARLLGAPAVLHEQNAVPGLTNRLLSRIASGVAVAFPEAVEGFPRRDCRVLGNPVRRELEEPADRKEALRFFGLEEGAFTLAVVGGSQGAGPINRCILEALGHLGGSGPIQVIHSTGRDKFRDVLALAEGLHLPEEVTYLPVPFVERMDLLYAAADLLVCRAGASTLAELTLRGKAAILIPFPLAAEAHQEANARSLERRGAALVMQEKDLSGEKLSAKVRELMEDRQRLREMERQSARLGVPRSAARLADFVQEVAYGAGGPGKMPGRRVER